MFQCLEVHGCFKCLREILELLFRILIPTPVGDVEREAQSSQRPKDVAEIREHQVTVVKHGEREACECVIVDTHKPLPIETRVLA